MEDGATRGAFVDIPRHAPVCSPLSIAAIADLGAELEGATCVGVHAPDAGAVAAAWRERGRVLRPRVQLTVLRLGALRTPALPRGTARVADARDLPLLRKWFTLFQERHPENPSQVEFVLDRPLGEGNVVVWEKDGRPVAMASRSLDVAGVTRMGLAYQPPAGTAYSEAAFICGCVDESRTADQVVVISGTVGSTATYRSMGFVPVADRVVLRGRNDQAPSIGRRELSAGESDDDV